MPVEIVHPPSPRVYFIGGGNVPMPVQQPLTFARSDITFARADLTFASTVG